MEQNNLGSLLKEERGRLGLSQQALSDHLGTSKATIQNWEGSGGRDTQIPADKLAICAKLGMDVQFILTGIRSVNLLRVAEELTEYRRSPESAKKQVDQKILAGVIAGVDEYLVEHNLVLQPDKKADLIMLLCDFLTSDTAQDKPTVKSAVAKIIQLRTGS